MFTFSLGPVSTLTNMHDRPRAGNPVAAEPRMQFRAILLQKGLDPADAAVLNTQSHPNGTENVFHAVVPLRSTPTGL